MKPFTLAIRAIGTQLAMRLYIPATVSTAIIGTLLVAVAFWLTTISSWWWLLFVPITALLFVMFAVAFVVLMLIRYVRPPQTKTQKQAVKQFVDRVQSVADIAGTPKFIILFRVVRSIAAPTKSSYLPDLVSNKQLAGDFREVQKLFTTDNQ